MTQTQPRLSAIRAGETINVLNINEHAEAYMVLRRCAHAAVGFYCATCSVHLANVGQLEMHSESGAHAVAVWCSSCRYYQAPDREQLDALQTVAL